MGKIFDIDAYKITSTELKKYLDDMRKDIEASRIILEDSFLKFPVIGNKDKIYIDTTTNIPYRFDEENLKYYKIGFDIDSVTVINGIF